MLLRVELRLNYVLNVTVLPEGGVYSSDKVVLSDYVEQCILGCDIVYCLSTFRINLLPPFSG
jgi:hypothetical protein